MTSPTIANPKVYQGRRSCTDCFPTFEPNDVRMSCKQVKEHRTEAAGKCRVLYEELERSPRVACHIMNLQCG